LKDPFLPTDLPLAEPNSYWKKTLFVRENSVDQLQIQLCETFRNECRIKPQRFAKFPCGKF